MHVHVLRCAGPLLCMRLGCACAFWVEAERRGKQTCREKMLVVHDGLRWLGRGVMAEHGVLSCMPLALACCQAKPSRAWIRLGLSYAPFSLP